MSEMLIKEYRGEDESVEGHMFKSCLQVYLGVRYSSIDLMSIYVVNVVFHKKREARDMFGGYDMVWGKRCASVGPLEVPALPMV